MLKFSQTSLYLFGLLCVFLIPFPFHLFPFQQQITNLLFGKLLTLISENLFGIMIQNHEITSDSWLMFLLVLLLFCIAILTAALLSFSKNFIRDRAHLFAIFNKVFCYYIALQLLKYGCDKIFKWQFYLPEPNILYTPFGKLDKDILYWSTMGTSYSYSVFLGVAEILAAVFIIIKRTRIMGLFLAVVILINVVAINLSFDISVKFYSSFLLFLSILVISPQINSIYQFLILKKNAQLPAESTNTTRFIHPSVQFGLKIFVIGIIFLEALYPYLKANNFNDDTAKRPYLHGAYKVIRTITLKDSSVLEYSPVKRFFIHRNGYIIFQNKNDEMRDFRLSINKIKEQFTLTDYDHKRYICKYKYHEADSSIQLQYAEGKQKYLLEAKVLDWKKLPVLKNEFHWMIDVR